MNQCSKSELEIKRIQKLTGRKCPTSYQDLILNLRIKSKKQPNFLTIEGLQYFYYSVYSRVTKQADRLHLKLGIGIS